jgi:hypothetical protein
VEKRMKMKPDAKVVDANRFEILKSLRDGMLSEMQEFRGAMWKSTLATHAVIIAFVSWLFTKGVTFDTTKKILLTLGITTFLATCILIVSALKRNFTDHAIVVNKINHLFGVYESGTFIPDDTLFLSKLLWTRFGEKGVHEPIFRSAYISLGSVYVFALCAVWIGA